MFWGGQGEGGGAFWGPRGGPEGSAGPLMGSFSPIKVLYGTQSGSKRYIMVQMANLYKVCITDPFLDL